MSEPETTPGPRVLPIIRSVRRRWRLRIVLRGLALTGGVGFAAFLASAYGLEALRFSATAVTALRIGAWSAVALTAVLFLLRPLLRRVTDEQVALYLEEHEPSLEARVLGAVEVETNGRDRTRLSPALLDRLVERAVEEARSVEYGRRVERSGLYRSSGALAAVGVAVLAFQLLAPDSLRYGARSLLLPTTDAEAVNPYSVAVEPGDVTVARGSDQLVTASPGGFESDDLLLFFRSDPAGPYRRLSMIPADSGAFELMLLNLEEDTDYFVEADGIRSATFRIEVAELPYVDRLEQTWRFPAYTGLPPRVMERGGDVAALRGTRVELRVHPTIPTPAGRIVVNDQTVLELEPGPDGTLTGELRVERPGIYRIELARSGGELVPASPEYTIDVLSDQPPTVSVTEPGRDAPASPLDEVFVEARADDDYGVREMRLVYSVNGADEDTARIFDGGSGDPLRSVTAGHTLFLEEWELEPGDVISYWVTARDNTEGGGEEVVSDIYFIQVRPFAREYRQAEQMPGGEPMGGGEPGAETALSQLQRQVVAATFNLLRDRDTYSEEDFGENTVSVALAQGRVRQQVATLVERMNNRGLPAAEERFREIAGMLPEAVAAMEEAEALLRDQDPDGALGPEQRALRVLQKAEETYERYVGQAPPQGGGGQASGADAEDLADLFELEMDKLKNQYETLQRGERRETDEQVDEVLEKLKELSRRQQQEAERQRRRAERGQAASGGATGGAQRALAEETEEAARQLQRLARESGDRRLEETARRLQETADAMRRSASGAADSDGALDRLDEARRRLERVRDDRQGERAREALERARRLAESQEAVQEGLEELPSDGPARREGLRRLVERKEEMVREAEALEGDLDRMAGELQGEHPEVARALRGAADEIRERRLKEKLAWSRGGIQEWDPESAREFEEEIAGDIEAVRERAEDAARAADRMAGDPGMQEALERARDLVRGAESMERRLQAPDAGSGDGAPRGTPRALTPEEIRQFRREFQERAGEARKLRQMLREEGRDAPELDDAIGAMEALQQRESYEDLPQISVLQEQVRQSLRRLEFTLRREVEGEGPGRATLRGSDEVPPEFRELVEEYFRALAREGAGGSGGR